MKKNAFSLSPEASIVFIELRKCVRVAVDADGFYDDTIEVAARFDIHREAGTLSRLESVATQLDDQYVGAGRPDFFNRCRDQIDALDMRLASFSEKLASNARRLSLDLKRVPTQIWERHALEFEKRNKELLGIISPSSWIA